MDGYEPNRGDGMALLGKRTAVQGGLGTLCLLLCLFLSLLGSTRVTWAQGALGPGDFTVQVRNGGPLICEGGEPVRARMFYGAHFPIRLDAGPDVETLAAAAPEFQPGGEFDAQVKLAAESGVPFITFDVPVWPTAEAGGASEEPEPDCSVLDRMCEQVLAAYPGAKLIPRVYVNASTAWLDAHPEEEILRLNRDGTVYHPGKPRYDRCASAASRVYRRAAAHLLEKTVRHLEARFGASFAGIHPAGQNSCEWFTPMTWADCRFGYSVCERQAFRAFAAAKYSTDEALQRAWGQPSVTRETADVPSLELWAKSEAEVWLDVARNPQFQQILDFNEWAQHEMTDTVLALSAAARRGMTRPKLVLVFYGYTFEFAAVPNGPAKSAHYDLRRILRSPDVDLICSPLSYFERGLQGSAKIMLPAESVLLAGKLYVQEDDTRTPRTKEPFFLASNVGASTTEELQRLMYRNTRQASQRNYGSWWMDLGGSGWYNDPAYWEPMKELRALDEAALKNPTPYRPAIGLFVDERSMQATSHCGMTGSVYRLRQVLGQTGEPYGQYLLDDLLEGRTPWVRVCILPAAMRLSVAQRAALREILRTKTVIWLNEPGILDEQRGSGLVKQPEKDDRSSAASSEFRFLTELTGFEVEPVSGETPQSRQLAIRVQPGDEVWSRFPDGRASVVFRPASAEGLGASVYVGLTDLPLEVLQKVLRNEGGGQY